MNNEWPKETLTVFILEDDKPTRLRLCNIINNDNHLMLAYSAESLKESRQWLIHPAHSHIDIFLIDLGLPDGYGTDFINEISQSHQHTKIMVISRLGDENSVIEAIKAGAKGYLLKDNDEMHIIDAIKQLACGGSPISPAIAGYILDFFKKNTSYENNDHALALHNLTAREKDVLQYVARGYSNKEIGQALEISPHTVASHVKHIYQKLEVTSRSEASSEYYSYQTGSDILQKSALQMTLAMKQANKSAAQIIELLEITFQITGSHSVKTLYQSGFAIKEIFIAMRQHFHSDDKQITGYLSQLPIEYNLILNGLLESRE
ncbi:MAG TPA: response regulator transcription factor [Thiothrix sp.]|nr:response regulator transcription factor [Thiothrix sp.]